MTLKKRKVIFWILALVFPIISLPVILWSFGYRFSFEGGVTRTGGLFLSSIPATGAQIYVDNKLIKETSFLSRGAFVQGLTPRSYTIRILSDGFYEWTKKLEVESEFISEAKALLVKNQPHGEVLEQGNFTSLEAMNDTILLLKTNKDKNYYFDTNTKSLLSPSEAKTIEATLARDLHQDTEELIDANKKGSAIDKDGGRILWWKEQEIWVEWQPETRLPLYAEKNPAMILKIELATIRNAAFYPRRDAAIAAYANGIFVIELDGRGGYNVFPLYKGIEPNFILLDIQKRIIYILDDGNLIEIPLL